MKLAAVIEELIEERGLDQGILTSIITEGILAGYQKRYPELELRTVYDKRSDDVRVEVEKEVVNTVEDEDTQISVRKARTFKTKAAVGDKIWVPFEEPIGRIEILRAKQVIAQRIRHVEASAIYDQFKDKEGTIVHGTVHKAERNGVAVKIHDTMAFLPRSLSIPTEKYIVGAPIRALLKEVLEEPRNDNQLILERSSEEFLRQLFELEIPEVFEKLVEIKKIVRIPGYKSKVVVASNDPNIDPVGTCIGVGGVRIRPILKELASEKIDVIGYTDNLEYLIEQSLKPAKVNRVELVDDQNAKVWLDEDQRSVAIGKGGQNILLASRLTGVNIELVQPEQAQDIVRQLVEQDEDEDKESSTQQASVDSE